MGGRGRQQQPPTPVQTTEPADPGTLASPGRGERWGACSVPLVALNRAFCQATVSCDSATDPRSSSMSRRLQLGMNIALAIVLVLFWRSESARNRQQIQQGLTEIRNVLSQSRAMEMAESRSSDLQGAENDAATRQPPAEITTLLNTLFLGF